MTKLNHKDYLINRLHEFFNTLNYDNWDGYGAYPIEQKSYENALNVLNETPLSVLTHWNIFPVPNGTISLEFKHDEIAGVSIGNEDFSYAAIKSNMADKLLGEYSFNINNVIQSLTNINKFLGYN